MKLMIAIILIFFSILSIIIITDLLMGAPLKNEVSRVMNPFSVMELSEYAVIYLLIFAVLAQLFLSFLKRRRQKKANQ